MAENPDIQITDKHYAPLGRVANAWATFEFYIDQFIWTLMDSPPTIGACVTAQLIGPAPRFRAAIALTALRHGSKESIDALNKFSQVAQGIGAERNRLAHDPMFIDEITNTVERMQITADRKLVFELREAKIDELTALERKIWSAVREFTILADKITTEMPTSCEIPTPPYWTAK